MSTTETTNARDAWEQAAHFSNRMGLRSSELQTRYGYSDEEMRWVPGGDLYAKEQAMHAALQTPADVRRTLKTSR